MPRVSKAEVKTANGAVLMRHLCQHWGHKFPVECGVSNGRIELPQAVCVLKAEPDALEVCVELAASADQARLEMVVEEHLKRFGFREELVFAWTREE
jgi:hypothetical protein